MTREERVKQLAGDVLNRHTEPKDLPGWIEDAFKAVELAAMEKMKEVCIEALKKDQKYDLEEIRKIRTLESSSVVKIGMEISHSNHVDVIGDAQNIIQSLNPKDILEEK